MRNPLESWQKSDSLFWNVRNDLPYENQHGHLVPEYPQIGPNDLDLLGRLVSGGQEHRKAIRTISIWTTITPTRCCWQEIDTYKIATVRNSCSTMHKLGHRPLVPSDFADEDVLPAALDFLNALGQEYRDGGKKDFGLVIRMKRHLPEGFLQRADYHLNYENALNMFLQRKNHRLPEWRWTGGTKIVDGKQSICDWIYSLPYMSKLIELVSAADVEQQLAERNKEIEELKAKLKVVRLAVDG
jgi:hypothetical protein